MSDARKRRKTWKAQISTELPRVATMVDKVQIVEWITSVVIDVDV